MSDDSSWSFAAGLFVGALTGAALATLFTPRSGAQNRETVRERGLVLKARVNEATTIARESANATATTLRGTANTAVDRVQSTAQTVRSRVSDTAERVSDTAERVGDRVSSIRQRGQDAIETTADSARDAIETTAGTSETPVRRAVARVYNTPAPTSTADDLANRVEAQTSVTGRATEMTEQAAGRAEQAVDTTVDTPRSNTDATLSADVGTLPDTAAVVNGANTLPSTTGTRSTTGIHIDTTYSTPAAGGTMAGQTEPLTQPLNVDAGTADTSTTAASSIENAANENDDTPGQLGRNQVGNRYRR
jgi:gas vesicle protein